ncbi:MAG: L,D-transpeptidase family protein [Chloroflexota bacterium]
MKKNGRVVSTRINAGILSLRLLLLFGCVAIAFYFFAASPANAFILASPTPTQENLWANVYVAKPAYTHTPTSIPTELPTEMPTSQPAATETPVTFAMEIVSDAPAPVAVVQGPASQPASSGSASKYILVDISEQHMYVYENGALMYSFVASTGIQNSTRVGRFAVQTKLPNAYGATWNIWMPNWLGIYYSGSLENGIHALPILPSGATLWEGYLGSPVSYGCVVLGTYDSTLLYDWAELGTVVEIRW